jgi:hypothetical protein
VTAVIINGFTMTQASSGDWREVTLPAGQTIALTYTGAPAWSWLSPNC